MMKIGLRAGACLALAVSLGIVVAQSKGSTVTDTIAIAPLDDALTFARVGDGSTSQLIAVQGFANGRVKGVDLSALQAAPGEDAIDLVNRMGYAQLKSAIERSTIVVDVAAADLGMPVSLRDKHIAVGTNYPEHAQESTVEGGPFLFPKFVVPTGHRAPVPAGNGLLDYEVEFCLVTMNPIAANGGAEGGVMLCNDVTNRATLLRNVDPNNPQSGKGFTSGKSAPGYLPVGNLFVVPRDLKAFVSGLTLQLSVNGEERQRAAVTEWLWDLDEILRQSRLRRDVVWAYWGGEARLPFTPDGAVPSRTLILAGTPAGTVFNGLAWTDYVFGILDWLFGGWDKTIAHHVVERHIAGARLEGRYLKPGDTVSIRVDRLGVLDNKIVP